MIYHVIPIKEPEFEGRIENKSSVMSIPATEFNNFSPFVPPRNPLPTEPSQDQLSDTPCLAPSLLAAIGKTCYS